LIAKVPKNNILANDINKATINISNPTFIRNTIVTVTIQQKSTIKIPYARLRCLKT